MIHAWLLLVALPALQTGRKLPPLPSDFHLCAVARETADYAFGTLRDPEAFRAASATRPVRIAVHWGTLPAGDAAFTWDEGSPPIQLGKPTDSSCEYGKRALFLLDARRRLRVVSFESEDRQRRLLSALATARAPSRRFDEEELDWAWFSARDAGFRLPRVGFRELLDGIPPQAGHIELALRFGDEEKLEILQPLRWKLALDAQDVEWLELAAHDVGGCQDEAVRALLERGLPVPPAPFLSEQNRLSARLAAGDEAARVEVVARIERAERAMRWDSRALHSPAEIAEHEAASYERRDSLLAIVAWGPTDLRPRLVPFVKEGVDNSTLAWLALGGSAQELQASRGANPRGIGPWDFENAGTLEALDLSLARVREIAQRNPLYVSTELVSTDHLVRRLQRSAPKDVLERVRPALRACLELPGVPALLVRLSLVNAGDTEALAEIARSNLVDRLWVPTELDELLPGDEIVPILVQSLLRHLAGFEWDDTERGPSGVASFASRLHARNDADRARALRLFDAAEMPPEASADEVILVRWALGDLPEPRQLLGIGRSLVGAACRLDLAAESPRYSGILGELRKDPHRHWWVLAALHDEASLPVFGAWLTAKEGERMAKIEALLALEKMGSPAGATYIYDALPELERNDQYRANTVLGEIESPDQLARVATTSTGAAFLVLLGRRS